MKANITTRSANILNAVKKIEEWCINNLNNSSYRVFVLRKTRDPYMWEDIIYSVKYKSILLARGDHGRWGAMSDTFETGMTEKRFERYYYELDGGASADYTKLNDEGNLVFESNLVSLIHGWKSIKEMLSSLSDDNEFKNFKA